MANLFRSSAPLTIAGVMASFNKTISDLKLIESQQESIVASKEAVIAEATAAVKTSTETKNEAAAVRAKLEALVTA